MYYTSLKHNRLKGKKALEENYIISYYNIEINSYLPTVSLIVNLTTKLGLTILITTLLTAII